jgi:hypothetical protein
LVDKKGHPKNMYEFAGEADIIVTCLSLNKETVRTSFYKSAPLLIYTQPPLRKTTKKYRRHEYDLITRFIAGIYVPVCLVHAFIMLII